MLREEGAQGRGNCCAGWLLPLHPRRSRTFTRVHNRSRTHSAYLTRKV